MKNQNPLYVWIECSNELTSKTCIDLFIKVWVSNGISTFDCYLMPHLGYTYMIFKRMVSG